VARLGAAQTNERRKGYNSVMTDMTIRVSDTKHVAWLDCGFCGETRRHGAVAQTGAGGHANEIFPDAELLLRSHFVLHALEAGSYTPCTNPPMREAVARWRAVNDDTGTVLQDGNLLFPSYGTHPRVERLR
jgi:hypothetical protein